MIANRKTEFEERVSRDDFLSAMTRIREQKTHASEYSGAAGQITRNEIEMKGLNRKALALHLQLGKLDQPARVEVLRSLLQYEDYAGTFDQVDAFDDIGTLAGRIVNRIPNPLSEGGEFDAADPARTEGAGEGEAEAAAPKGRRRRSAGSAALDSLATH